jgi:uncharacterized protein
MALADLDRKPEGAAMLFAILCTDKPHSLELRMKVRPDHLAYLETLSVKGAGPFLDADDKPNGSMIIVEAADRAAAQAIAEHDPYAKAGLFQKVEIRPWKWLIKNPETA